MSYCKKSVKVRDKIRITKFFGGMLGNHSPRQARRFCQRQSKKMEKHNARHLVQKLFDLMVLNFEKGDWHLSLTYPQGMADLAEAEKHLSNFLKRLRRFCKKAGIVLKYIIATHVSKKGQVHHHILLPQAIPFSVISEKWRADKACGTVAVNSVLWGDYDYYGLATYLVKFDTDAGEFQKESIHERGQKRYRCSTNLERPEESYEIMPSERWLEKPRAPKGWRVEPDSVYNGVDDYTGYPYQTYTLIPDIRRRI